MSGQKVPVTFLNGYTSRKNLVGIVAITDKLPGVAGSVFRFFYYFDNKWGRFPQDFSIDFKSLTYLKKEKTWWLLGKNGEVVSAEGSTLKIDQIPGAGLLPLNPYGYVNAIRNIDEELYVCGYGRQVYCRRDGKWISIANDILTQETARGFMDMDGSDKEHIYAVGWKGEIHFYDGQNWHKDNSPTDVILNSVRCVGSDEVWICGYKGTVVHGRFNDWEVIKGEDINSNWYCIEEFEGRIYLAGNGILAYIEDGKINKIDPGVGKAVTTHRLHAREGLLWSIGEKDILVYDGTIWKEILHPDNM